MICRQPSLATSLPATATISTHGWQLSTRMLWSMMSSENSPEPRRSALSRRKRSSATASPSRPLRAVDRHGDITVHACTDGTYDKTGLPDPLILSLYFSLRDERITQLIIIHNRALA